MSQIFLTQYINDDGSLAVAARVGNSTPALKVGNATSVYALAQTALRQNVSLSTLCQSAITNEAVPLESLLAENRIRAPIDHPDPAHLYVTGTGLTHLGSAEGRDRMHKTAQTSQTDSMKMFLLGLEGGKPSDGEIGAQPEWFYKGNGRSVVAPEAPLARPAFALDGGEEPEIAGIYIIDDDGEARRLGFVLGNEFSDHVTEKLNYLWLAHSKLRQAALGPEIRVGALPSNIRGVSRVIRGARRIWEKPFLSGEANMSHSIANLEQHHFKYDLFRHPGDVHVHFFGTATLSFADGVTIEEGDRFEIEADAFSLPLRNAVTTERSGFAAVRPL